MPTINAIKLAASGKWPELLSLPLTRDDHNIQPCPKCGGTTRFNLDKSFDETGIAYCNKCLKSSPETSDGINTYAWWKGISNSEAIEQLAEVLGISSQKAEDKPSDAPKPVDPSTLIDELCSIKNMPKDAFMQFGVILVKRAVKTMINGKESWPKVWVARVSLHNEKGEKFGSFDLSTATEDLLKGMLAPKSKWGLFLPESRLPQPGEQWFLSEGCKDPSALIGLGYPNACGLPTSYIPKKFVQLFRGVDVVIIPDHDTPGYDGANKSASFLNGIARSIKIAKLLSEKEHPVPESKGKDVRDVIREFGADAVRAAIDASVEWVAPQKVDEPQGRPEVLLEVGADHQIAEHVVRHLGRLGWDSPWILDSERESSKVFVRGGKLARVVPSEDPSTKGRLTIQTIPTPLIRERVTQACRLGVEVTEKGETSFEEKQPPKWLIESIAERKQYSQNIRPLVGIIQSPTLRADGTIIQSAGYDEASGLIYCPNADYPKIPENPNREDALRALESLNEVVVDFPFATDSDRSAWLSMLFSMLCRSSIPGGVPMFGISATTSRTGKGLLCDVTARIAYGHDVAKKGFPSSQTELSKLITTTIMEALPCRVFDNVSYPIRGDDLECILTATMLNDRILGGMESTGDLCVTTIWVATGNNLRFEGDMPGRVIPIRLESPVENPESRKEFLHDDLASWVLANRPRLVCAALTILRSYFVAGKPKIDNEKLGGFESWIDTIRGCIMWLGLADPLGTRKSITEDDESKAEVERLIDAFEQWDKNRSGKLVRDIDEVIKKFPATVPLLCHVAREVCGPDFNAKKFSNFLRKSKGRIVDGLKVESEPAGKGLMRWRVKSCLGGLGDSLYTTPTRESFFSSTEEKEEKKEMDIDGAKTTTPNQHTQPREPDEVLI